MEGEYCDQWFLRLTGQSVKTANAKFEQKDDNESCPIDADERKRLSLEQDVIHCTSHGQKKVPKHISLAMSVRHLIASRHIVTMLNRVGNCSSYDEIESVNSSLAVEILAKSEQNQVVVPSNISPSVFIQAAADNNDINEETLDGKNTTMPPP